MLNTAEKYLKDHNNPITKFSLKGTRIFLPTSTKEEQAIIDENRKLLETILGHSRVDRRCARIQAVWLKEDDLATVIKAVGSLLANFGFQDKTGKYLYPEEVLYLLESNKLELIYNEVPMSIQEGYKICLNGENACNKYMVYKKLVSLGYKLVRTTNQFDDHKRKLKCDDDVPNKIARCERSTDNCNLIFDKLRKIGPKQLIEINPIDKPDYSIYLPTNTKKDDPDFNLYIMDNPLSCNSDSENDIFAVCSGSNVGFYKFYTNNVPILQ